jgi:hypothetical protein
MIRMDSVLVLPSLLVAAACGGGGGGGDDPLPCPSGNCGQESFRRAVPTSAALRIAEPTGRMQKRGGVASLDAVSGALTEVATEVDEINAVIDDIFSDLDDAVSEPPELETDTEHQWRYELVDFPGLDEVVRVTTTDGVTFTIEDYVGASGFEPATVAPVLHGDVVVDGDVAEELALTVDLDAYAEATGELAQGEIVIAVMPLADGEDEVWFDFHEVSLDGGPIETSRTTAWSWDETSVGFEYVADVDGAVATVYARWDADGGRYDHHLAWDDPKAGPLEEIATNCWTVSGAEVFDAWAVFDTTGAFYGELDGEESSCEFGPVADHPDPSTDFDDLPDDGEWELLELGSICDLLPCE